MKYHRLLTCSLRGGGCAIPISFTFQNIGWISDVSDIHPDAVLPASQSKNNNMTMGPYCLERKKKVFWKKPIDKVSGSLGLSQHPHQTMSIEPYSVSREITRFGRAERVNKTCSVSKITLIVLRRLASR